MNDKYKNACIEYARASAEVRRLGIVIGDAIRSCQEDQAAAFNEKHFPFEVMDDPIDHLKMAFEMEKEESDSGYGYQSYFVHHDNDIEGYLQEKCSHCLNAYFAIQERKKARKIFGIAKRRIGLLGRS